MPSRLSTEYWKVPVTGTVNGTTVDVSTDPVYMALITSPSAVPTDTDWHVAQWENLGGGKYAARLLVGPEGGAVDFSTGTGLTRVYVWVKVTDNPEVPVINAGAMYVS